MNERLAVFSMALVAALGLVFAPWAAVNREIGARSTLLLLPERFVDFTGRTESIAVGGLGAVLLLSLAGLAAVAGGAALRGRKRHLIWLAGGALVVVSTMWGLTRVEEAVEDARVTAFVETVERAIESPRGNPDLDALRAVAEEARERPLDESLAAALAAGLNVRRLPYSESGMGLAAFLALVAGWAAMVLALRFDARLGRQLDRVLAAAAIPATSILLALVASAVVVLTLQPTPTGRDVLIEGPLMALSGRLDTLWYAYVTLFADSLGTVPGFLEALKFSTPLIFTGLAVAFGFQAGLFNIGAPGQMILGALAAMLVGVYLPGPTLVVLPLAVLAAALGGGLWGALPGWLKARFGANEVINTILLNYIASSLLLFVLSSSPTFAAPAVRVFQALGIVLLVAVVALLLPAVRRLLGRRPRLSFAVGGVVVLLAMVAVALPAQGQPPYVVDLPFKAPGSEPKSHELQPAARIPQLPALLGIDIRTSPGVNAAVVDVAAPLAGVLALLVLWLAPRAGWRRWGPRLGAALGAGVLAYAIFTLFGLRRQMLLVPPTNLNLSFLLALLSAVFMQVLLWRTKWGYELRAVGVSPKAAEYGGADISRNVILAMTISGAFAGLTATHYVLGGALEDYSLRQSLPINDGFDGIAVALLGGNTPLGVVLSAFLFGVLKNGGSVLNITFSDLTRDVVNMILALVVLFIAAKGFLPDRLTNPLRRRQYGYEEQDPRLTAPIDPTGKRQRSEEA